jgi:hypothetical protein
VEVFREKRIGAGSGSKFRKKLREFRFRVKRRKRRSAKTAKRNGIQICGIFC